MLRSQSPFHLALQDSHPHLSDFLHSTTSSTSSNKSNSSSSNGVVETAAPPHITFSQEQIDCICDSLQQRGDIKRLDSFLKSYQGHMTQCIGISLPRKLEASICSAIRDFF